MRFAICDGMKLFLPLNRICNIGACIKEKNMANMIVSGVTALENVAKVHRNETGQYSSKALTGKSGIGKADGGTKAAEGNAVSFRECMENAIQKETAVFPEGEDVVMAHPPMYRTNYSVDMNKSKEEMTLDEYKQYICNTVSSLPVSDSMKACSSGVLIFKEEAFESMKNNPEYEKEVIGMLREGFSTQLPGYAPNVGYQVIGKTSEECYGAAIPVKNYSWLLGLQSGGASSGLSASGFSGLGLTSSGLLASRLSGLGLSASGLSGLGLHASGLSGLGFASSGLSGLGLTSSGLSSLGLASSGLSGLGLTSSGLLASSLAGLGLSSAGISSLGLSGAKSNSASQSNRINAYKNNAKNRSSNIRTFGSSERKWRVD